MGKKLLSILFLVLGLQVSELLSLNSLELCQDYEDKAEEIAAKFDMIKTKTGRRASKKAGQKNKKDKKNKIATAALYNKSV